MNYSEIIRIKNAKFSGYYFYLKANIWGNFEISKTLKFETLKCVLRKEMEMIKTQNKKQLKSKRTLKIAFFTLNLPH